MSESTEKDSAENLQEIVFNSSGTEPNQEDLKPIVFDESETSEEIQGDDSLPSLWTEVNLNLFLYLL